MALIAGHSYEGLAEAGQYGWSHKAQILAGTGGGDDTTAPSITIVSPTPGVDPGDPGGFPADYELAKHTPIVVDVADITPGVSYVVVFAVIPGTRGRVGVFRGDLATGTFLDPFDTYSTAQVIGTTLRLSVRHDEGWSPGVGAVEFKLDAVDSDGNVVSL